MNIFRSKDSKDQKPLTFFLCLLLASFFWLLSALSKEYPAHFSFPVNYTGLPANRVVANRLPDSLHLDLQASGFELLRYKWKGRRPSIRIDAGWANPSASRNVFHIHANSISERIAQQLGQGIRVTRVMPDSILFNYNKKAVRLVPVKANIELGFANQFQLADSIVITPSEIEISGEQSAIDEIGYLLTKKIVLSDLRASKDLVAEIELPAGKYLGASQRKVKLHIPVAEFTEGSMELPVVPINLPQGFDIKTFPDKVGVRYKVRLSDYDKIDASLFQAVVDCSKAKDTGASRLKVELQRIPPGVAQVKLSPEKVEFIIRK